GVRLGHVEAGLRSRDWTMPEEINRVVIDRLCNLLFIPSRDAGGNLAAEGIAADRIHFAGNVMIDSLCWALPQALARSVPARRRLEGTAYGVVTLHRTADYLRPRDEPPRGAASGGDPRRRRTGHRAPLAGAAADRALGWAGSGTDRARAVRQRTVRRRLRHDRPGRCGRRAAQRGLK